MGRLCRRHPDSSPAEVAASLAGALEATRDARVQGFRLLLAEREAHRRLTPRTGATPLAPLASTVTVLQRILKVRRQALAETGPVAGGAA